MNLSDAVGSLNFLFGGASLPCHVAADTNADGTVNITDAVALHQALDQRGLFVKHPAR